MSSCHPSTSRRPEARAGFTLLELMLALTVLAVVTTVTYVAFNTTLTAWKKGQLLTDRLHHGDFALEQLVAALRSAYYPAGGVGIASDYGFILDDDGDGEGAADTISWVKVGGGLIGRNQAIEGSPHRVKVTVERNERGRSALAVKAWRIIGQLDDFDPDDLPSTYVTRGIIGLNCRCQDPEGDNIREIDWTDEWKDTNRVPRAVELTVYLEPLDDGEKAVEVKRIVQIPVGDLSWRTGADGGQGQGGGTNAAGRTRQDGGGGTR